MGMEENKCVIFNVPFTDQIQTEAFIHLKLIDQNPFHFSK